jgi:hypothetical protein
LSGYLVISFNQLNLCYDDVVITGNKHLIIGGTLNLNDIVGDFELEIIEAFFSGLGLNNALIEDPDLSV